MGWLRGHQGRPYSDRLLLLSRARNAERQGSAQIQMGFGFFWWFSCKVHLCLSGTVLKGTDPEHREVGQSRGPCVPCSRWSLQTQRCLSMGMMLS